MILSWVDGRLLLVLAVKCRGCILSIYQTLTFLDLGDLGNRVELAVETRA